MMARLACIYRKHNPVVIKLSPPEATFISLGLRTTVVLIDWMIFRSMWSSVCGVVFCPTRRAWDLLWGINYGLCAIAPGYSDQFWCRCALSQQLDLTSDLFNNSGAMNDTDGAGLRCRSTHREVFRIRINLINAIIRLHSMSVEYGRLPSAVFSFWRATIQGVQVDSMCVYRNSCLGGAICFLVAAIWGQRFIWTNLR